MVKLIVIGAGQRGAEAYAPYVLDHRQDACIVGVAEPREDRRMAMVERYGISEAHATSTWQELLAQEKFADAVIIATQDRMHCEPTIEALKKGYHVLCEKPMSPDAKECLEMGNAAKKYNRILSICHELRYTPFFSTIKDIIESGKLGKIISINLSEGVAYWHQAHSYVRGNWRDSNVTSPMILSKSCHDMDILCWLISSRCTQVSSYGHLTHFTEENAPEGAPQRCLDGCPARDDCPYYAPRIYMEWKDAWQADVIRKVVSLDPSPEALLKALKEGPYGRCVYHCDNNVVDHQIVNLDFENGTVASFSMCAFTHQEDRIIRVMGTKGELTGSLEKETIDTITYLDHTKQHTDVHANGGHSGGDYGLMKDFIAMVAKDQFTEGRTSADKSVESHLIALAAEKSRVEKRNINMDEYISGLYTNN